MLIRFSVVIFALTVLSGCETAPKRHEGPEMIRTETKIYRAPGVSVRQKQNVVFISRKEPFIWPVNGYVVTPYGAKINKGVSKGIDIRADEGMSVKASRAGRVVFRDPRHKGFGKTVILDHGDSFQTVYSYNSEILASVGDAVEQSSVIARVGRTGRSKDPCLHFEIRKDGIAQNPANYLPR